MNYYGIQIARKNTPWEVFNRSRSVELNGGRYFSSLIVHTEQRTSAVPEIPGLMSWRPEQFLRRPCSPWTYYFTRMSFRLRRSVSSTSCAIPCDSPFNVTLRCSEKKEKKNIFYVSKRARPILVDFNYYIAYRYDCPRPVQFTWSVRIHYFLNNLF